MKIAVIGVKGIPAKQGGIEYYAQELYQLIASKGHTVDLYARSNYTQVESFSSYQYKGIKVISLPSIITESFDALFNSFLATFISTIIQYDVIHFHALGPSLFCWLPRLFSSAKVVATCHGLDWQRAKWSKLAKSIIYSGERSAIAYAHDVIVVSEDLQTYFQNEYGIETTYIPTAPAKYADSNPTSAYLDSLGLVTGRYILFLGRLVPEKRPDLLLEAFQLLHPSDWKLVLVGDSSGNSHYKKELLKHKNEKILFTNTLTGNLLAEIVRNAGLFVLPSDLEGLPLGMLEAMREGVPVIASDIPSHCQLIGEDRGLLFQAGNLQSLVSQLEKFLSQPEAFHCYAQKAKEYVNANHSWEEISKQNLTLYTKPNHLLTNANQKSDNSKRDPESIVVTKTKKK
ncbi:MAG: glycosyltransferase family 4 protein [Halothece sp.]|jgi:glycosyltransferase involved in cell wall biosynthesis